MEPAFRAVENLVIVPLSSIPGDMIPMKTLVVANQKGGVGKTALVVNFAWDFAERGNRIAVVDMDVQGNCSFTLGKNAGAIKASELLLGTTEAFPTAEEGITLFPGDNRLQTVETNDSGKIAENLHRGLQCLDAAGYDFCLVDSPAAFGVRFMIGLLTADYVLAPIELEAYSIQGIKQLVATFSNARKVNPKLKFLGILANKVDRRNPRHREHLSQLTSAYGSLFLPTTIGLRGSIAEALVSGEPVWKNRKTAAREAAKEIRAAANLVYKKVI